MPARTAMWRISASHSSSCFCSLLHAPPTNSRMFRRVRSITARTSGGSSSVPRRRSTRAGGERDAAISSRRLEEGPADEEAAADAMPRGFGERIVIVVGRAMERSASIQRSEWNARMSFCRCSRSRSQS